jgi:hypothetical protein
MKTTIFTLFFLSSVCFIPQLGNLTSYSTLSIKSLHIQDTTTVEYWKKEAQKWKAIADENRLEAYQIMTFAQRHEHEAKLFREIADSNAVVAIENEREAIRQRDLATRNEARAIEAERHAIMNAEEARRQEIRAIENEKEALDNMLLAQKWIVKAKELEKIIEQQKKEIEELKKKIKN